MDRTSNEVLFSYRGWSPLLSKKPIKTNRGSRPEKSKRIKKNMDDKEKEVAETKALEESKAIEEATNLLAEKDAEITQLKKDRDNYRTVALKRKGKLPGDAEFFEGANETTGLTVEEEVKKTLIEREINRLEDAKDIEARRLAKENAELRLALKNRPGESLGSGSGSSTEVKDNVFSPAQLEVLRQKAERLKADPEKFIEAAKKNILSRA